MKLLITQKRLLKVIVFFSVTTSTSELVEIYPLGKKQTSGIVYVLK